MSFPTFDLNLLLVLNAVLTEGSVAKAATRMHVTPPAVSNALARLRLLLRDPLFTKKGRGLVPTPRALELAPLLARTLGELHSAVRSAEVDIATSTRRLTLALSDAAQVALLPRIALLFRREMPRARLRVIGIDSMRMLGGLAGQEVDVVLGPEPGAGDVRCDALFEQPAVLVCRKGHPALGRHRPANPLAHVSVEMSPGQGFVELAAEAYRRSGTVREVVMTVPTFSAAVAVVAASDLVATVPQNFYLAVRDAMQLRTLPFPFPSFRLPTHICWHSRTESDPVSIAFRDLIRRALDLKETASKAVIRSRKAVLPRKARQS